MINIKVSQSEYKEFLKYYAWQLLSAGDYRLGQAFLNYFPKISNNLINAGDQGAEKEMKLYNERDNKQSQKIIDQWIEKE